MTGSEAFLWVAFFLLLLEALVYMVVEMVRVMRQLSRPIREARED